MHRVAIFNPHGYIVNVCSQSDVIRFLAQHIDNLGAFGGQEVIDIPQLTAGMLKFPVCVFFLLFFLSFFHLV